MAPRLDEYLHGQMDQSHATGMIVGLVVDGELACAKAFGTRGATSGQPVDQDTVFRIASLTKSFTALAVLKLRDEGKIVLDKDPGRAGDGGGRGR